MRRGALVLALLAVLALAPSVRAAPPSDAWLEGYATAVLARELGLSVPSLRATQGVITLSSVHVIAADRARVLAVLQTIPGVTRVEMVGGKLAIESSPGRGTAVRAEVPFNVARKKALK